MYTPKTTKLIGTSIHTEAEFRNFDKVLFVPTIVTFKYKPPGLPVISTVISGVGTLFSTSVLLDKVGIWTFRWECDGIYSSAEEFDVMCEDTILK